MEVLVIIAVLAALGYVALSVYLLVLGVSVARVHRSAMQELHQKLERDRLAEQRRVTSL